jgi:hypothetical protein
MNVFLGLLGSIEIPLRLLTERETKQEDLSSIYSLSTSHLSEMSLLNSQKRTFDLQYSSNNSQISIKYHIHFNE